MDCSNCGIRVVRVGSGPNEKWMHQIIPDPESASWAELVYVFCKLKVAEPDKTPMEKEQSKLRLDLPKLPRSFVTREDLTTDRPDMISVVREELRQNVGESLIKKDRGDLLETVVLTKENVSKVAKETGRSEQALRDALSHAKVMDRVCYIAFRYSE